MPGYVGTLLDIHDQDGFREYLKGVAPRLAKHGGRIVLRGPIAGVSRPHAAGISQTSTSS